MTHLTALLSSSILFSFLFVMILSTISARAITASLSDSPVRDPSIIHPSIRDVDFNLIEKNCKICMPSTKEFCKLFLTVFKKRGRKEYITFARTVSITNHCMQDMFNKHDRNRLPKPKPEPVTPISAHAKVEKSVSPPSFKSTNIKDYFFSKQFDQRTNAKIYGRVLELLLPRYIDPTVHVSLVRNDVSKLPTSVYRSYSLKYPTVREQFSTQLSKIRNAITSSVPIVASDETNDHMALLHMLSRQSMTCNRGSCTVKINVYTNEMNRKPIIKRVIEKVRQRPRYRDVFQVKPKVTLIRRGESWWTVILDFNMLYKSKSEF